MQPSFTVPNLRVIGQSRSSDFDLSFDILTTVVIFCLQTLNSDSKWTALRFVN